MPLHEVEKFNFDYHGDNAKDLLIKALVDIGFKEWSVNNFYQYRKHVEPWVFETDFIVGFGFNNTSTELVYSIQDHLFYWGSVGSAALNRVDPNIKDLESLICLYLK